MPGSERIEKRYKGVLALTSDERSSLSLILLTYRSSRFNPE